VDTVGVSVARAQTPAGDTSSAYHIEVSCWPDLDMNACRELVRNCGAPRALIDRSLILADIPKSAISCLTAQGSIRSLREQVEYPVTNNTARVASHLDSLQTGTLWNQALQQFPPTETWLDSVPYTGKGILVGVYDTGIDWSHPDFNELNSNGDTLSRKGRLKEIHAANPDSVWNSNTTYGDSHGTHVAGIIGGNGWLSNYSLRGLAPKGHFFSSGTSFNSQVGHVVNHSHISEWDENYYAGDADGIDAPIFWNWSQRSETADSLVKTMVAAAANNGGYSANKSQSKQWGYHSILVNAKNPIIVGNYASLTGKRNTNSSMGPTWDGRIKPDIMAPGSRIQYVCNSTHPLRVWIDYVRLYRAGSNAPYWEDHFSGDALTRWNERCCNATYPPGEIVSDSEAEDGVAFFWEDSSSTANESYITRPLDTPLSIIRGDILEIRMRGDTSGDSYSSLDGQIYFGNKPSSLYDGNHFIHTDWNLSSNGFYTLTRTTLDSTEMAYYLRLDINHEEGILSTIPYTNSDPYEKQVGTSMASPHVTGIVALILQKYRELTGMGLEKKSLRNSTSKASRLG
jgi:subtilisin family serine protease